MNAAGQVPRVFADRPPRRRPARSTTAELRAEILQLAAAGLTAAEIAAEYGKDPRAIEREAEEPADFHAAWRAKYGGAGIVFRRAGDAAYWDAKLFEPYAKRKARLARQRAAGLVAVAVALQGCAAVAWYERHTKPLPCAANLCTVAQWEAEERLPPIAVDLGPHRVGRVSVTP